MAPKLVNKGSELPLPTQIRLDTPLVTLVPPTTFSEIKRSCRKYHDKVEGKYHELGMAARWVSYLAREVTEAIRVVEERAKLASSQHVSLKGEYVNLKEVLHEYLEVFGDDDDLWETLDLAYDPKDRVEFTRRKVLTPLVLRSSLHGFRKRILALTAERDSFRARRIADIQHFEESVAELKRMQRQKLEQLQEQMHQLAGAAQEKLMASAARSERLSTQLAAATARAERAEAELGREHEERCVDCERAAHREAVLEAEVSRLRQALESVSRGAHLSEIAHANSLVERQMRHSAVP